VINRADLIRGYQSRDCSLFPLYAIFTITTLYAPADVLPSCCHSSHAVAQESFFYKKKLLYDFPAESGPLVSLQGSIILCTVILDLSTDKDYGY
jgi:hypothetical protein